MTSLQRRLPGVRFEVPPAALREALPRMDIGLFVGFAASGPVDLPVAVESVVEFEAVFGVEIVLARDPTSGSDVGGLLHPSVRGFFSQGGRRCWIVRVAGIAAVTTRFPLANLLLARRAAGDATWRLEPASISARSPGSWADTLRIATRLAVQTVQVRAASGSATGTDVDVLGAAALALRVGELLRFSMAGEAPVLARIDAMDGLASEAGGRLRRRVRLLAVSGVEPMSGAASSSTIAEVAGFDAEATPVTADAAWDANDRCTLRCRIPANRQPGTGAVLSIRFAGSTELVWMTVGETMLTQAGAADGQVGVELSGKLWRARNDVARTRLVHRLTVGSERPADWLRLDVRAGTGDELDFTLEKLGMAAPVDPDSAGLGIANLPDDLAFFGAEGENAAASRASAAFELTRRDTFGRLTTRFPLAFDPIDGEAVLIPLGDEQVFGPGLAPVGDDRPALQRDGLDVYSWTLFAEPLLAEPGSDTLADQAEALRFLGPHLRALRGMHAAFGSSNVGVVDEPTLLAVPDAVQCGWQPVVNPQPPWIELPAPAPAPAPACDRDFSDCAATPLAAPRFVHRADPDADGSYLLQWTEPEPGLDYELRESGDAAFAVATTSYQGPALHFAVIGKQPGSQFYRVRGSVGPRLSPWSPAVQITVGVRGYETLPWAPDNLLALHRLMLRTAAGRGDMLAVLALPQHYRFDDAVAHASALRDPAATTAGAFAPGPIGVDEVRALSHGALYHPWTSTRRVDTVVACPPDGAACGQLAASALERGAWMAVANRPLRDVVALSDEASRDDMRNLLDAQVNLVRASPHGFVLSTADTVSPEADWRPINVRRLMTLLRRLALRRGATYVFEPNGATLRRTVERGFEAVMDELFRRGAFAGATARDAYRVEVGDEVNTPERDDLGQFWVELKVAPALPLTFLTVRLARSGERLVARETR